MTSLLKTLKLFDEDNTLSLTSCLLILAMFKFAFAPLQTETLVALLGAAFTYSGKKLINQRRPHAELEEQVADAHTKLTGLANRLQLIDNRTNPVNRR